jgi:hypothetical protein
VPEQDGQQGQIQAKPGRPTSVVVQYSVIGMLTVWVAVL